MHNDIFEVTFQQMRYFICVVECGSITQAAERLYIAQPALSKRMMALEERLELQLFVHEGRRVKPTEAGQYLYQCWKELLGQYEDGIRNAGRMQRLAVHKLNVGCFPAADTASFLHPYLRRLMLLWPDLEVKIKRQNRTLLLEDLYKREVDMAFLLETDLLEGQGSLERKAAGSCRLVLVAPVQYGLGKKEIASFQDMDGHTVFFTQPDKSPQKISGIHRLCMEHGVKPGKVVYVNSDVTALSQVICGKGISVGPRPIYPEKIPDADIIPIGEERISIIAVWNRSDIPEIQSLLLESLNDFNME